MRPPGEETGEFGVDRHANFIENTLFLHRPPPQRGRNNWINMTIHKYILWLSSVFGCGFRSLIPRADVQRFGLIDSWLSSALIGRSVATAAELCFVAQSALLLHAAARARVPVRGCRRMAPCPARCRSRGVLQRVRLAEPGPRARPSAGARPGA